MTRKFLFATLVSIVLVAPAAEAADHVVLALQGLGSGSAEEIKNHIFSTPLTVLGPDFRAATVAALPDVIRNQRITFGPVLRRAEKAFAQVLELYGRRGTIEIVLYKSEIPQAALWRGCVLAISDSLAGPLTDAELLGIIAHELSHTYFMDEIMAARRDGDVRSMKVVELKCDAFAYLTLKLLGRGAGYYIAGLRKMEKMAKEAGLASKLAQTHPEMWERARFLDQFDKTLGAATSNLVERALHELGTGTVSELRSRLFSQPIMVLSREHRLRAISLARAQDKPVNLQKPDEATSYYDLGVEHQEASRYQEALEAFTQAVRLKPEYAMAHNGLGGARFRLGLYNEAVDAFQQAILLKPDYLVAYNHLGLAYAHLGRHKEAVESLKQAIRLDPHYARSFNNLGHVYYLMGKYREAGKAHAQALRLDPHFALARFNLGVVYLRLGNKDAALEQYSRLKVKNAELANQLYQRLYAGKLFVTGKK